MVMSTTEKLLFLWLLLVMALSFFFSHFWGYTLYALQKAFPLLILPFLVVSKIAAGIAGIHFLC
jgi:hypothetical protein